MRKGLKKSTAAIVFAFLLVFSAVPAFAQDLPEPFCGELAEDDCTILASSQEAMLEVGSGVYNSEINLLVAGIPGLPVEELSFSLVQEAVYALDPALTAELVAMQSMAPEEMAENMDAMFDLLLGVYATMAYDGQMVLTLPQDVADLLTAQAGVEIPTEINLQVRVVEGYAYINLDDLAVFAPDQEGLEGWAGIDILSVMEMGLQESLDQAESNPASLAGFGLGNFFNSEEGRATIAPYISVERLDDSTAGDQDVAVFDSTFDVSGFLGSPLFRDIVISQLPTINQLSETQLTEEEATEALTMLSFVGPMLFAGLDFHTTQAIGIEDFYTYESDFVFNWDLSSLVAVAQMVDSDGAMGLSTMMGDSAPVINFDVSTTASDHNNAPEITAPEDAQIIPLEAMQ